MNIRTAKVEDLEAIVDIYNQAITAGQKTADTKQVAIDDQEQWFEGHIAKRHPIFVAEDSNIIVGYLSISAYRPGRQALRFTAEVSYYIHFEHHRKGVASNLLQHAIVMCPALQIKTLFAILMDSNQASIGLLEKHGFQKWGHMPKVAEVDGVEVGHLYYGLRINKC